MQHELVLDPAIRDWVFLPLIVIMFLVGILRHNATSLLRSDPKPGDKEQVKQSMALMRSRRLRANARYIPEEAYHARRHYFSHPTTGVFSQKLEAPPNALAMMSDPDVMQNMMKGCANRAPRTARRTARRRAPVAARIRCANRTAPVRAVLDPLSSMRASAPAPAVGFCAIAATWRRWCRRSR